MSLKEVHCLKIGRGLIGAGKAPGASKPLLALPGQLCLSFFLLTPAVARYRLPDDVVRGNGKHRRYDGVTGKKGDVGVAQAVQEAFVLDPGEYLGAVHAEQVASEHDARRPEKGRGERVHDEAPEHGRGLVRVEEERCYERQDG